MSKRTVLYERHLALGGRVIDFHGWELPVQYEGVLAEHRHCRAAASVFDTSHMGQFLLKGDYIAKQLSAIGTQNAETLAVGKCKYGFLLNEEGGVLDDTILMRLGEDEFLLVVNAGTLAGDLEWILSHLPSNGLLADLSAAGWAKVDLQGPESLQVLDPLVECDLTAMGFFSVARTQCCGQDCIISRTGYTGELGYEIMAEGEDLLTIFDKLIEHEGVKPAGLGARDSLRLEVCYPLYGQELGLDHNPIEAGLKMFIPNNHAFIGSEALKALAEAAPERHLVAFKSDSRRRTHSGNNMLLDGKIIGVVTSGGFSPSLEVSIGLGYVRTDLAEIGQELQVDTGRALMPIEICEKPLYKEGTCRTKVQP